MQEPYKGYSARLSVLSGIFDASDELEADRYSGTPMSKVIYRWARPSVREEFGRDPEQGFRWHTLEGWKPKGVTSDRRAKPLSDRQGLSGGLNPRNRGLLGRPFASAAGAPTGETVRGIIQALIRRIPSERGKLRRVNPMSAAGMKQDRHGTEGSKPSRG